MTNCQDFAGKSRQGPGSLRINDRIERRRKAVKTAGPGGLVLRHRAKATVIMRLDALAWGQPFRSGEFREPVASEQVRRNVALASHTRPPACGPLKELNLLATGNQFVPVPDVGHLRTGLPVEIDWTGEPFFNVYVAASQDDELLRGLARTR